MDRKVEIACKKCGHKLDVEVEHPFFGNRERILVWKCHCDIVINEHKFDQLRNLVRIQEKLIEHFYHNLKHLPKVLFEGSQLYEAWMKARKALKLE